MAAEQKETANVPKGGGRGGPMGGFGGGGAMRGGAAKPKQFKKSMGKLITYLKKFWPAIIISLIFAVAGTVIALFGPKLIEKMTQEIIKGVAIPGLSIDFVQIGVIGAWMIVLYIISAAFGYIQQYIMAGVTTKVSQKLRSEISEKINRLPLKYFDKNSYGDVLSRVTNDVDTIGQTLSQSLSSIITSITMVVGVIIMMFTISWELTLINLVSIPLSMLLVVFVIKSSQKYFRSQQAKLGALNGHVEEIFSAHNVVKIYGGDAKAEEKFTDINKDWAKNSQKAQFFSGLMFPVMNFVGNLSYVFICVIGAAIALNNVLFIGSIVAFMIYVKQINQPIGQLASMATTLQSTAAAAERVFDLLSEKEQEDETTKVQIAKTIVGDVEFKKVNFSYDEDKPIIREFSAKIKAGQKIAIVGPTGAGKTTLVNLLMRFYEIDSGDILIDNRSIKNMKREEVRSYFGMVLQDAWLFSGSILENLRFGNSNASNEEIIEACKAANVHHFIQSLPKAYENVLDEETNLSQGQKQLLTIARAMVQNAPMLILDEATSSVDTRTEVLIQQAMDRLMKGRTSFVIAHRLSTIKNADLIIVMRDGKIVETGSHKELLDKTGFYSELYQSQFTENQDAESEE